LRDGVVGPSMSDDVQERLWRLVRRQTRLLRKGWRRRAQLEHLLEVSHELARTPTREEIVIQRAAERAGQLLAADAVGLLVLDGSRLTLRGRAGSAEAMFGESGPAEIRRGIVAAVNSNEPVVIPDSTNSWIVVALPLRTGYRVLGMLAITRSTSQPFADDEVAITRRFAAHVATAVENARLYRKLRESNRQKDDFLARLGHELRNTLAPVVNALHLERVRPCGPQQPEQRAILGRQIRHLAGLVDDMLDASRIRFGKLAIHARPIDLRAVARRTLEALKLSGPAEGHDFMFETDSEPVVVMGDEARLGQVIANLLHNAVKYSARRAPIYLTVRRRASEAVLCVQDQGIGIAPEMLQQVFDLFTQADRSRQPHGGLGLGLALVRALVECHGGTVKADSQGLGHGGLFTVQLPLCPLEPTPDPADPAEPPTRPSRILVVEDNSDAREALRYVLEAEGHGVAVAGDGVAAIELAAAFRPEFVFIDLGLPGLDGLEVARRLRASPDTSSVYLVAITGYGHSEYRRRTREAGFDEHLVKPVAPEKMFEVMARLQGKTP
jgi:signal transduction histidine kinase/ActR/RegA family two-component response regulator